MEQQTAVEDLIIALKKFVELDGVDPDTIEAAIEFAELRLEMEKQQMIEFAEEYNMYLLKCKKGNRGSVVEMSAEQYYKETFKK